MTQPILMIIKTLLSIKIESLMKIEDMRDKMNNKRCLRKRLGKSSSLINMKTRIKLKITKMNIFEFKKRSPSFHLSTKKTYNQAISRQNVKAIKNNNKTNLLMKRSLKRKKRTTELNNTMCLVLKKV